MNEQNETKNTEEKEKKPVNWKSEIISWIQILVAAAAIAFVLNTFIIANSRVPSASMENTIMTGSRVIGSLPLLPFSRAGAGRCGDLRIWL